MALSALSLGIVTLFPSQSLADNPIIQTSYTADPAPVVYGDTLYLYTSHDEDITVDNFYTMNDWRLYSTKDMVNWTDHGSPAGLHTFSWSTDSAWAPQAISRNGQYYLYVPLNNNTGARIGVSVADNPIGPFTDPLGNHLVAFESGNIDPTVFIDDDGQAYLYWGHTNLRYVKLNEDMISYSGSPTNVNLPGFTEGPWFYKRESLYYMLFASIGGGTEKISYATSDSPTGPWTVRGDVMAAGKTFTNHAGVVDYKGHSYFFYHNSALPGGNDFRRSVCVEEFTYGADGSIPQLTMSSEGPEAVATLNPFEQVEAETIAFSSGLKTEECDDTGGGLNVRAISAGDYIKVKNVDFLDGVTTFEARVASAGNGATIELHLDSETGTLLGTCDVSGASSWTTISCPVSGGAGTHDLFLTFSGQGDELFKFNWWRFTGPTMPTDGGAGGTSGTGGTGDTDATSTGAGGAGGGVSTTTTGITDAGNVSVGGAVGSTGSMSNGVTSSTSNSATIDGGTVGGGTTPTSTSSTGVGGSMQGASGAASSSDSGSCSCRTGAASSRGRTSPLLWLVAFGVVLRRRARAS